jgi:hypothetical protein
MMGRLEHVFQDFFQKELHLSGIYLVIGVAFALVVMRVLLGPSKGPPSSDTWLDKLTRLSPSWQWITGLSFGLVVIAVFAALRWLSLAR